MHSSEQRLEADAERRPAAPVVAPVTDEFTAAARLASTIGNQAFTRIAREGSGILPDGRAHPDVEAAIASSRGGGQTLDQAAQKKIGGGLGDPLDDVRVHTDDTANQLAQSVSARAFTTGQDVYFANGQYQPGSSEGQQLLAHELTHVVQQRGASSSGPLQVSQPQDALETEAEASADELLR